LNEIAVLVVSVVGSIALYVITIVKTLSWIMEKVDRRIDEKIRLNPEIEKRIDERIENHPIVKQYILINYKLGKLEEGNNDIKKILEKMERKSSGQEH
jgi:hypothetical protein